MEIIEVKELYRYFADSIKASEDFKGWKKSGAKKYVFEDESFKTTIEIEQMKSVGSKMHHLSLTLAVYIPSDIDPIRDIYGRKRKKGTLLFQWSVRNRKGIGAPTIASDRTWMIKSESDVEIYKSEIKATIIEEIPQHLTLIDSPEKLLDFVKKMEHINQFLPLVLTLQGKAKARVDLLDYLSSAPNPRPQDQVFDWATKYDVLPKEMILKLKKANIQHVDSYSKQMREICAEIA